MADTKRLSRAELKQYRVIALEWELKGNFNGTIQVEPEIQFAIPADRSPLIRCQYKLDIEDVENKALSLSITTEGIFAVDVLPEKEPGTLDRERLTPITDIMEQELIQSVEKITGDFGIPPMTLALATETQKEE